jgi:hypothetical protein
MKGATAIIRVTWRDVSSTDRAIGAGVTALFDEDQAAIEKNKTRWIMQEL